MGGTLTKEFVGLRAKHTMKLNRSTNHQLFTIEQNKKSLTPCDDKRYL